MRLLRHSQRRTCQVNMAPLIDVVFLLIIFFMVVSQFTQAQVDPLELPEAAQATPTAGNTAPERLIVNIHWDGRLTLSGVEYPLADFDALLARQVDRHGPERLSVLLRGDRRTAWRTVAQVLGVCGRHGVSRVRVAVLENPAVDASEMEL